MKILSLILALVIIPSVALADANYVVDKEQSQISFSGTHAGKEFSGVFEEWDADIAFYDDDLQKSKIMAVIKTGSATTGNKMYDGTLPQDDWFDVKNHPEITFESSSIEALEAENTYQADGMLNIRGQEKPFSFEFTLSKADNGMRKAVASFPIDRIEYGIGVKSDKDAEWVSREIALTFDIAASHKVVSESE